MDKEAQTYIIKAGAAWSCVGISKYLSMLGIETWEDAAALAALELTKGEKAHDALKRLKLKVG